MALCRTKGSCTVTNDITGPSTTFTMVFSIFSSTASPSGMNKYAPLLSPGRLATPYLRQTKQVTFKHIIYKITGLFTLFHMKKCDLNYLIQKNVRFWDKYMPIMKYVPIF